MRSLFDSVSFACSKLVTTSYSTSFSLGIRFLSKEFRAPVYAIYGFVRFADEIVDTFHEHDKHDLLKRFREDTYRALNEKISLNPILNCFQQVVNKYHIDLELIDTFLDSMEMDLEKSIHNQKSYEKYILGSAEVVGLMCLKVFCKGNEAQYKELTYGAMRLGSAFQKINFLRDLNADYEQLGRTYFPGVDLKAFDANVKAQIEKDIRKDFHDGFEGIKKLPKGARFGVYMAYIYYLNLFKKIRKMPAQNIMKQRVRISNKRKFTIFLGSYLRHNLNIL